MPQIYLMRHAESTMQVTLSEFIGGRQNQIELTPRGVGQAGHTRDYLLAHDIHPTRIYASLAERAIRTAEIALDIDRSAITLDERFQEVTHGDAEGRPRKEMYTPEAIHQLATIGMDFKFPGGESTNMAADRMHEGVLDVARQASEDDIIYIASHGIAIKSLIARLCGYDQQWIYTTISHNVCLTRLTLEENELAVDHDFLLVDTLK